MDLPVGLVAIVNTLGTVLLHFLWQGALIGILYALARSQCVSVSARYRVGLFALFALAASPFVTFAWLWSGPDAALGSSVSAGAIGASVLAAADRAASQWQLSAILPWLVAVWMGGVLMLAMRSLWQWRRLKRIVHEAIPPAPEWTARLAHLVERFQLRRPVRLLCSAQAVTPMLIGWIRPVVLLPASMLSGFTPAQVELIIAHELGHICRWDYLANLFQVVLETILFYHPVVHWISRDVRNARESCCDDLVLKLAQGNPITYARTLADLEELRLDEPLAAPALGANGGVLLARIRHIVGAVETADPLPRTNSWPLLLIVAAVALFAWRQHAATSEHAALSLANAPAQALALVSGNPQLAAPRSESSAPPPAAMAAREAPLDATALEPVRIDSPRVGVVATTHLDRVRNVAAAAVPLSITAIEMADVATPAVTSPPQVAVPAVAEKRSALHIVSPTYPARAMAAGIEGKVDLEYAVNANGDVTDVRVVRSQPAGTFDAAAKAALADWRFAPGQSSAGNTQSFAFTLHGHGNDEASLKCQQLTGSMICRRPGE
jgi:bla regulator protein blaR1